AMRRSFAEFVGTFAVVFVAAGSVLVSATIFGQLFGQPGGAAFATGLTLVATALAYGLTVAAMVSAVGHISGGHFNPAVTLGFVVTGRIVPVLALFYWIAQFAAAALAALLLRWIFTEDARNLVGLGAPTLAGGIDHWKGIVLEGVLVFFLVWVFFATAADPGGSFKAIAGLAVGFAVTFDVLVGGPLTGAAVNPARAFGPELVQNAWSDAWVWYAGPFVGAALAATLYDWLYLGRERPSPVGAPGSGIAEPRPGDTAIS
ncbi:MAG: aquaporin, partial [Actinomycetota bacterium]|nr:aquaporin [Actinomycetota bacterium]